jgi:hypothetical protein
MPRWTPSPLPNLDTSLVTPTTCPFEVIRYRGRRRERRKRIRERRKRRRDLTGS